MCEPALNWHGKAPSLLGRPHRPGGDEFLAAQTDKRISLLVSPDEPCFDARTRAESANSSSPDRRRPTATPHRSPVHRWDRLADPLVVLLGKEKVEVAGWNRPIADGGSPIELSLRRDLSNAPTHC